MQGEGDSECLSIFWALTNIAYMSAAGNYGPLTPVTGDSITKYHTGGENLTRQMRAQLASFYDDMLQYWSNLFYICVNYSHTITLLNTLLPCCFAQIWFQRGNHLICCFHVRKPLLDSSTIMRTDVQVISITPLDLPHNCSDHIAQHVSAARARNYQKQCWLI